MTKKQQKDIIAAFKMHAFLIRILAEDLFRHEKEIKKLKKQLKAKELK